MSNACTPEPTPPSSGAVKRKADESNDKNAPRAGYDPFDRQGYIDLVCKEAPSKKTATHFCQLINLTPAEFRTWCKKLRPLLFEGSGEIAIDNRDKNDFVYVRKGEAMKFWQLTYNKPVACLMLGTFLLLKIMSNTFFDTYWCRMDYPRTTGKTYQIRHLRAKQRFVPSPESGLR